MRFLMSNWNTLLTKLHCRRRRTYRSGSMGRCTTLAVQQLESRRFLTASVMVTTLSDDADGVTTSIGALESNKGMDGEISLREAIEAASNDSDSDITINFSPG